MKYCTAGLKYVASSQNNLNNCATGAYNVTIGYNAMNYAVNCYNSICIRSGAGCNITASDNICIGINTGTDTVNGYSRYVCIGYALKISQSNQISLGTLDTTVDILGSMSTGSMVIPISMSHQSLGYLPGTTSNIQSQIGTISDNTTHAFSNITRMQTTVDILSTGVTLPQNQTTLQSHENGRTSFRDSITCGGNLTQVSSGFNLGYYKKSSCYYTETYNFGTDHGV